LGGWELLRQVHQEGHFDSNKILLARSLVEKQLCKNPGKRLFSRGFLCRGILKQTRQNNLKYWLDPVKSGVQVLNGKQFYEGENLCDAFTNLSE
jgi:hypothetical protein